MNTSVINILGVNTVLVYDEEKKPYYHSCGAELTFGTDESKAYEIKYDNKREFVILISSINNVSLIEPVWYCFFKALEENGEDTYCNISKNIYGKYFSECFNKVNNEISNLYEKENIDKPSEPDFMSHDEMISLRESESNPYYDIFTEEYDA